jgi:hypothetical protein
VDALAQMLSLANVAPGGRVLVVDDASGLIIASVLDRLGGSEFKSFFFFTKQSFIRLRQDILDM